MVNNGQKSQSLVAGLAASLSDNLKDRRRCGDHVSPRATVASLGIQLSGFKRALGNPESLASLMAQGREDNARPYDFPRGVSFDVAVNKKTIGGSEVVVLNRNGSDNQAQIIYLIGGAYLVRSDKQHWQFLNRLAITTGCQIIVPLYPLLPQYDFTVAYQFLLQLYTETYNQVAVSNITLMGDSAGAGLAAGFCEYLGQRGLPQPGNLVLISPWVDATLNSPLIDRYVEKDVTLDPDGLRHIGRLWAGKADPHDYRVSPLYGDVHSLRRVMVFTGTHEVMYPQTNDFVRKLRQQGVQVDYHIGRGLFHIYPLYDIPEASEALKTIDQTIRQDELPVE